MQINSTLRIGFIIQGLIIMIALLLPVLALLKDDATTSTFNTNRLVISFIAFIWLFGGAFFFASRSIKFISLTDNGIIFGGILGKNHSYQYSDIVKIETGTESLKRRYYQSAGYRIIKVQFGDGNELKISQNIYSNFDKLRSTIYKNTDKQIDS